MQFNIKISRRSTFFTSFTFSSLYRCTVKAPEDSCRVRLMTPEEIAQNALGCLEPDDPGCIVAAIEGVFLPQVIARASIKLEAIQVLLATYAAATGEHPEDRVGPAPL